jgi:hypothetical protein
LSTFIIKVLINNTVVANKRARDAKTGGSGGKGVAQHRRVQPETVQARDEFELNPIAWAGAETRKRFFPRTPLKAPG